MPITKTPWSRTCAPREPHRTTAWQRFLPPDRLPSCRCPTAAAPSCGASRAPRRDRLRALDPQAFGAALLDGERRRRSAVSSCTTRGELSAAAAICARLRAAARGTPRRRRACGASAGRTGTESWDCWTAPRSPRRSARRGDADLLGDYRLLRRYERRRKSENSARGHGAGWLGAAFSSSDPRIGACAARVSRPSGRLPFVKRGLAQRAWGSRATCRRS